MIADGLSSVGVQFCVLRDGRMDVRRGDRGRANPIGVS